MSYSILYNQDNVPHPHSDQNLEFLYIFQIFITWQVPVLSGHITIQELFPNLWFKSDSSTMSAGAPNRPRPAVHCNRRQTLSLGQEQSCGWTRSDERLGGSQVPLLYPTLKHTHPCWSNFIVFHPYSHSFGHPRFRLKRFQYMYTCIYTVYIYIYVFISWSEPSLHHVWSHTVVHVISRVIVIQPCLMYILCPCHRCQGTFSAIPSSGHQKGPGRYPTYHVVCIYDHIMWVFTMPCLPSPSP